MKRIIEILFAIIVLVSCNSQKVYSNFDISYSKSGGYAPAYENLLIKDNTAHYSFEGEGKKIKQDFKVSDEDLKKLNNILSQNNFRRIQEDHKKLYDNVTTSINVKKGPNEGSKTDASLIMPNFRTNWTNITNAFQEIINNNVKK
ncbi:MULTISPECIES: hypothetical protein [Chryseobacterium]|uniref:hypothetical protein n=1 Tax=Chryseobacterium TaxID=59732 RepID=UPI001552E07B|nr:MULTISPECIES: hypothetical protein [unclassified Chryseobacterium]MDC8106917.1 hypothetical protein [Chryseobacterium sp. B21-037]MDQ1805803.1 hypothetical protein [Chryseobacterium sp. CKR4-1]WBV56117.1 hypothetical protein PFY10_18115 [Chryseobacterium daecheongense]